MAKMKLGEIIELQLGQLGSPRGEFVDEVNADIREASQSLVGIVQAHPDVDRARAQVDVRIRLHYRTDKDGRGLYYAEAESRTRRAARPARITSLRPDKHAGQGLLFVERLVDEQTGEIV